MTSKINNIRIVLGILALVIIIPSINMVHADYGEVKSTPPIEYGIIPGNTTTTNSNPLVNVCIFQPIDFTMDPNLPSLILAEVQHNNLTATIVNFVDQAFQNYNCGHIIKIDRATNQNYKFTDRTIKYQVSGNTLTIYTYKTNNPIQAAEPLHTMTNWTCETIAHSQSKTNNYHITDQGYVNTYTGYCDPYKSGHSTSGELPVNVIDKSVDRGLKKLGL